MTELPAAVREMTVRGADWARWVEALPARVRDVCEQWQLTAGTDAGHGSASLVVPVRTAEGSAAMLKISFPDNTSEHEHLVLRRWNGAGAVRLLRADPHRRVLLLERLQRRNLNAINDIEACRVVAAMYPRLHVPALPQLPSLADLIDRAAAEWQALDRSASIPHRLVQQAISLGRELTADTDGTARVLHGDLHYSKVLAAEREPWLATAPHALNGDPCYELAPMLWQRWEEMAGNVREGILRRFYTLVDVAGLDEDRARGWVLVRAVQHALSRTGWGADAEQHRLTRCVAIAKAVRK